MSAAYMIQRAMQIRVATNKAAARRKSQFPADALRRAKGITYYGSRGAAIGTGTGTGAGAGAPFALAALLIPGGGLALALGVDGTTTLFGLFVGAGIGIAKGNNKWL